MGKWKEFKQGLKSPPPERLAAIEYRSHALNIIGVLFVTVILIFKGFWYIIFAFIFSVGVSYSQMISSYQKYVAIKQFNPMNLPVIEKDPSPTRRRSRIINQGLKNSGVKIVVSLTSIAMSYVIYNYIGIGYSGLYMPFLILLIYILLYYFPVYWIANYFYTKELKGGKDNEKTKREN